MGFGTIYESSIIRKNSLSDYQSLLPLDENNRSDIEMFNKPIVSGDGTVVERQSADDTPEENRDFDVSKLVKKYKKNPADVFGELKINFTDKQKEELSKVITDKKKLESFLNLAHNSELSANDIYAAAMDVKQFKPSSWFKRTGSALKSLFKGEFEDFKDKVKSETVHYAKKLGENISEINQVRKDFSSEGKVGIAKVMTVEAEAKDSIMHFVKKNNEDGIKIYTEEDAVNASQYIQQNLKKAEEFTNNAIEIESIKDKFGKTKYKGSTMVNYSKRVTSNSDIKETAYLTACKSDMSDAVLDKTTENLYMNPEMDGAIRHMVTEKCADGSDRYTAAQVGTTSTHLLPKDKNYCTSFTENITELSKNQNLSSSNILNISKAISAHPEIKDAVLAKIKSGNYTGAEIEKFCTQCAKEAAENKSVQSSASNSHNRGTETSYSSEGKTPVKDKASVSNPVKQNSERMVTTTTVPADEEESKKPENTFKNKIVINGQPYERRKVYEQLYKKFDTMADSLVERIAKDQHFIEVIKEYGSNKTLLKAAIENYDLLKKLKSTGNLGKNDLSDAFSECTNSTNTNVMLLALSTTKNASKSVEITKRGRINNLNDKTMDILNSSKDSTKKKNEIDELYSTGGKKLG